MNDLTNDILVKLILFVALSLVIVVFIIYAEQFITMLQWRLPRPMPVAAHFKDERGNGTVVVLGLGQSNAASHGSVRRRGGENVYAFFKGDHYMPYDPWPGSTGKGGSVWSRLGRILATRSDMVKIVISSAAVGGSSIQDWVESGNLSQHLDSTLDDLLQNGHIPDWVIWHQGETDAYAGSMTSEEYERHLRSVIQAIREKGILSPILVCMATSHADSPPNESIRLAQQSVWDLENSVYAGVDTDSFGDRYRRDRVHFNDEGLRLFAEGLVLAMERKSVIEPIRLRDLKR
ncbi:MAG: sialate O-acetylesterase [Verrucomicrobiota bacterium]